MVRLPDLGLFSSSWLSWGTFEFSELHNLTHPRNFCIPPFQPCPLFCPYVYDFKYGTRNPRRSLSRIRFLPTRQSNKISIGSFMKVLSLLPFIFYSPYNSWYNYKLGELGWLLIPLSHRSHFMSRHFSL